MIKGIHHITAISSNARKTIEFYTKILGLRLVKKTVNFDAPDTYHFYFGNEKGDPGTILTFFPFERSGNGIRGVGQATKIQFSVPTESFGYWIERFQKYHVKYEKIQKIFNRSTLKFYDFDGLQLELVISDEKSIIGWTKTIDSKYAITSFFGIEISVRDKSKTEKVLVEELDYKKEVENEHITRYVSNNAEYAKFIDIFEMPGWPEATQGAGTVHHIAFRTENDSSQKLIRQKLIESNLSPTPVVDRNYFHSIYFREPGGVLFEVATDEPGFDVDESVDDLGSTLKLPTQYESQRKKIEAILPNIESTMEQDLPFEYKFIKPSGESQNYFLLLHGTGADENNLIPLAQELKPNFGIISLRGNILEGMQRRFFKRKNLHEFDRESIDEETNKLKKFIETITKKHNIDTKKIFLLGFSNGANIGISLFFSYPDLLENGIFSHPVIPFTPESKLDLGNQKVFISSGDNDPFMRTPDEIDKLIAIFEENGAKVEHHHHTSGHQLTDSEFDAIAKFIEINGVN